MASTPSRAQPTRKPPAIAPPAGDVASPSSTPELKTHPVLDCDFATILAELRNQKALQNLAIKFGAPPETAESLKQKELRKLITRLVRSRGANPTTSPASLPNLRKSPDYSHPVQVNRTFAHSGTTQQSQEERLTAICRVVDRIIEQLPQEPEKMMIGLTTCDTAATVETAFSSRWHKTYYPKGYCNPMYMIFRDQGGKAATFVARRSKTHLLEKALHSHYGSKPYWDNSCSAAEGAIGEDGEKECFLYVVFRLPPDQ